MFLTKDLGMSTLYVETREQRPLFFLFFFFFTVLHVDVEMICMAVS